MSVNKLEYICIERCLINLNFLELQKLNQKIFEREKLKLKCYFRQHFPFQNDDTNIAIINHGNTIKITTIYNTCIFFLLDIYEEIDRIFIEIKVINNGVLSLHIQMYNKHLLICLNVISSEKFNKYLKFIINFVHDILNYNYVTTNSIN